MRYDIGDEPAIDLFGMSCLKGFSLAAVTFG